MDQQNSDSLRTWLAQRRGRQVALAAHVGVRPTVVAAWISGRRPVPVEHAADIETFSDGAVSRKALFPKDWRRIWPEHEEAERLRGIVAELLERLRRYEPDAVAVSAPVAINSEAREAVQEVA